MANVEWWSGSFGLRISCQFRLVLQVNLLEGFAQRFGEVEVIEKWIFTLNSFS